MGRKDATVDVGEHAPGAYPIENTRPIGFTNRRARTRSDESNDVERISPPSDSHIPPELRVQQSSEILQQEDSPLNNQAPPEQAQQNQNNVNNDVEATMNEYLDPQFRPRNTPPLAIDASVRFAAAATSHRDKDATSQHHRRFVVFGIALLLVLGMALVVALAVLLPPSEDVMKSTNEETSIPTAAPTMTSTGTPTPNQVYDTLLQVLDPVSGAALLEDESSPQYQALQWLASEIVNPLDSMSDEDISVIIERYVIALLYFSTNGPEWTTHRRFLSAFGVCSWGETEMSPIQHVRVDCENEGHLWSSVQELHIVGNNLKGSIPTELVFLSDLHTLELVDAELAGTVPDLSTLSNLHNLTLSGIGLTGTLPSSLGLLNMALRRLNVEGNLLTGELPQTLGALTNLEELRLANNHFQGGIPGTLSNLEQLSAATFHNNNFTGALDTVFCPLTDPFKSLSADCLEVACGCCTLCCPGNHNGNSSAPIPNDSC